jgi:hypothetical protein
MMKIIVKSTKKSKNGKDNGKKGLAILYGTVGHAMTLSYCVINKEKVYGITVANMMRKNLKLIGVKGSNA